MNERRQVVVEGIVQGVGFRPFVHGLARRNGLTGFVLNDGAGVTIEAEGAAGALDVFLETLARQAPPLAKIHALRSLPIPLRGDADFKIIASRSSDRRSAWVPPDAAACDACLRELFDPADRRYRYPFINCTHCGPRFTIVESMPYDRERTTMRRFAMCPECAREYSDPADRRFHGQPNACPRCGPRIRLLDDRGREARAADPIAAAADLLRRGAILAVKGMGGYHLACNAIDRDAVSRLRARKHRMEKPFALMVGDVAAVRAICRVTAADEALLLSPARPIVLVRKRENHGIAEEVAPGQRDFGVMLPYTPLHHLLLRDAGLPLVMTSGNLSEEPIAYRDGDALQRLATIADHFLVHDRDIHMRCDDSVARAAGGSPMMLRRARGYAPRPLALRDPVVQPVLACGAHLKNTFCLAQERRAVLSHHIGDLENYETLESFTRSIEHFKSLFDIEPRIVAHDLHPGYLSTRYALDLRGATRVGVQHHHAHIAACMAEHRLSGPVIGVALDGLGYGDDGRLWGGEFLIATAARYERRAHLRCVPMAGGERAIREPWRMALSYLRDAEFGSSAARTLPGWDCVSEKKLGIIEAMLERGLHTLETSSCGRLFDAVAAILSVRHQASYEGHAAIALEALAADGVEERYGFEICSGLPSQIDFRLAIAEIVAERLGQMPVAVIAAKFHNTVVAMIAEVCKKLRSVESINQICLGGGVFQNLYLLDRLLPALREQGFAVFINRQVPPNDGGIALGQAVVAAARVREGG